MDCESLHDRTLRNCVAILGQSDSSGVQASRSACSILVVASFPDSLVRFRGALLDALVARGHTVHVAAPGLSIDDPVGCVLREKGVVVHGISMRRTGMNPVSDVISLLDLYRSCRSIRPTCVLAYTVKPVVYGLWAARLAGVPRRFALITGVGYAFAEQGGGLSLLLSAVVRHLYSNALRGASRVFFQNPDDQRLFWDLKVLPPTVPATIVNGSGVDLTTFTVTSLPSSLRFLMIARLLGSKGVREYAEAARRVRRDHASVDFGLVGWIDEGPDAIRADELDVWVADGTLEHLGRLEDVRSAISDCSVYVLPSYREGTPRTVLEAMAMGRPIITTDAPGCRETVEEGENGFLVGVQSIDDLEQAMRKFITDPELASRLGARSRQIAEDRYDVRKVNAAMLEGMGL